MIMARWDKIFAMSLPPEKFREAVLLLLFAHESSEEQLDESGLLSVCKEQLKCSATNLKEPLAQAKQVLAQTRELDEKLVLAMANKEAEYAARLEWQILRLLTFELLNKNPLPPKVAIAEGVRLTRKFSTPASAKFMQVILDQLCKDLNLL